MESIVQKTDEVKVFKFEPDLPISELASAGEQQHASKLVSRVQQHHAKQISALVKQRYAECSKVISSELLQEFGDEIKLNWMREHYFKIVEEVLDASSTKRGRVRRVIHRDFSSRELPEGIPEKNARTERWRGWGEEEERDNFTLT